MANALVIFPPRLEAALETAAAAVLVPALAAANCFCRADWGMLELTVAPLATGLGMPLPLALAVDMLEMDPLELRLLGMPELLVTDMLLVLLKDVPVPDLNGLNPAAL